MTDEELEQQLELLHATAQQEENTQIFQHQLRTTELNLAVKLERLERLQEYETVQIQLNANNQYLTDQIDQIEQEQEAMIAAMEEKDPKQAEYARLFLAKCQASQEVTNRAFWEGKVGKGKDAVKRVKDLFT